MGKRGSSNIQQIREKILNLISNKKNANYKRLVRSYQIDHFGDNVALSSGVGDAHTLPTYMQSFSARVP